MINTINLKLSIQGIRANLVETESNEELSICLGFKFEDNWYFEELDIIRKDKDPYSAVVKVLCELLRH